MLKRLAGRAAFMGCIIFFSAAGIAEAKSFSSNSARDGGTEMYNESGNFGTNRGSGPAFSSDPGTGNKNFETPPMPVKEQPDEIEIMPVYPEVHPVTARPRPPIIVKPGN